VKDEPRAATVVTATSHVKLLSLERKTFKRLLGPLEDILRRQAVRYSVS
jgi:cAMP-dependent protein kinase regulator